MSPGDKGTFLLHIPVSCRLLALNFPSHLHHICNHSCACWCLNMKPAAHIKRHCHIKPSTQPFPDCNPPTSVVMYLVGSFFLTPFYWFLLQNSSQLVLLRNNNCEFQGPPSGMLCLKGNVSLHFNAFPLFIGVCMWGFYHSVFL